MVCLCVFIRSGCFAYEHYAGGCIAFAGDGVFADRAEFAFAAFARLFGDNFKLFDDLDTRYSILDFRCLMLGIRCLRSRIARKFLTVRPPEKNSAISACWRTTFLMSGLLFIIRIVIVFSSEGNKKGVILSGFWVVCPQSRIPRRKSGLPFVRQVLE